MIVLFAAYYGLTEVGISAVNDKLLHFLVFFGLTVCEAQADIQAQRRPG